MKQWHKSRSLSDAFGYAMRGIVDAVHREQNVRVELIIGTLVVCVAFLMHLSPQKIAILLLACGLVISLELMNTSFELLCDIVHVEYSDTVRRAKDIAAGAVLAASGIAVFVGIFIFLFA